MRGCVAEGGVAAHVVKYGIFHERGKGCCGSRKAMWRPLLHARAYTRSYAHLALNMLGSGTYFPLAYMRVHARRSRRTCLTQTSSGGC